MKLSIIIPLYNSEKYIRKCLDSLLNQDIPLTDYEIIVVNDGSPDNSYNIVKEYSDHFNNIKLVSQLNQGTSGARNTGIDLAQGEYMVFVDPDDYVRPNIYKNLLDIMIEDGLDMLRTDYEMVDESYNSVVKPRGAKAMGNYSREIVEGKKFLSEKLGYACYVWVFIYRSTLLKNNSLYFRTGFYLDDTEWLPRVLCHANAVSSLDSVTYYYVQREGSLIGINSGLDHKRIDAGFKAIEMLVARRDEQTDINIKNWYKRMITILSLSLITNISVSKNFYNDRKPYLQKLKRLNVYPLSLFQHSNILNLRILMINLSVNFFCNFIYFKKNFKLK